MQSDGPTISNNGYQPHPPPYVQVDVHPTNSLFNTEFCSPQSQSIRSRTTTTTSLASSEYVPLPDVLAGQELEECWEESEEEKGEDEKDKHENR